MAKYYCRSYYTTISATDDDDEKRFSADSLPKLRKYLISLFENNKDRYDDVFGREFLHFRNPVKVYDNVRCIKKPIGVLVLQKNYYVWKTEKGYYRVKKDGSLSKGVR